MSDVIYYKGCTCECDSSAPRLTIEGRDVHVQMVNGLFDSPEPPYEKTKTLHELARNIVDHSAEVKSREAAKRKHLRILNAGGDEWNEWRRSHPEIRPILYEEVLSTESHPRDLSNFNLANAVLV